MTVILGLTLHGNALSNNFWVLTRKLVTRELGATHWCVSLLKDILKAAPLLAYV